MRDGGNIITLGDEVSRQLEILQARTRSASSSTSSPFSRRPSRARCGEFVANLGQAVAIVLLVMLLFLGVRTGLVVASLVPAMVMALFVMGALGIGLDQMSRAALIIALGMLVDNAILTTESIMVQMAGGRRPIEAAVASARERKMPDDYVDWLSAVTFAKLEEDDDDEKAP